jgi:hypothetical protein
MLTGKMYKTKTKNATTTHNLEASKTGTPRKEKCAKWTKESGVNPTNNAKEAKPVTKNIPTSSWREIVSVITIKVDASAKINQRTTSVNSVLMS